MAVLEEDAPTLDEYSRLPEPGTIVDICQGLIEHDQESGTVVLAHSSVLVSLTAFKPTVWYSFHSSHNHGEVAKKCLQYLLFDDFQVGFADDATFETLHEQFPLLDYAVQQWPIHAKLSGKPELWLPEAKRLCSCFDQVRGANFTFWVQCLMPEASKTTITRSQPLYYAASFGLAELVTNILAFGADVGARGGRGNSTTLHAAGLRGHTDVASILLENGAHPDCLDGFGVTPLHWAKRIRQADLIELLSDASCKAPQARLHSGLSDYADLAADSWKQSGHAMPRYEIRNGRIFRMVRLQPTTSSLPHDETQCICCECDAIIWVEERCMICLHPKCGRCSVSAPKMAQDVVRADDGDVTASSIT